MAKTPAGRKSGTGAKRVSRRNPKRSSLPKNAKDTSPGEEKFMVEESIFDFSLRNMKVYSVKVNEDRAVPDLADGLKPVVRRSIWAASEFLMTQGSKIKTAKLVGSVIGNLHPHGDAGIGGALCTVVNSDFPAFVGIGNWGTLIDPPAAIRYTELRMSDYGRSFLNKDYLPVVDYVPNYDGSRTEPVTLPSLLPAFLMNNTSGIGVGMTTDIPAYNTKDLLRLCDDLLSGVAMTPAQVSKRLRMIYSWGGQPTVSKANDLARAKLIETGKGTVSWDTLIEEDRDKKLLRMNKFAPGVTLETTKGKGGKQDKLGLIDKIRAIPQVASVYSEKGLSYVIKVKPSVNFTEYDEVKAKVEALARTKVSYSMAVTVRKARPDGLDYDVSFVRGGVVELLTLWLKTRIRLEAKSLDHRIVLTEKAIAYTNLLIHACDCLDIIFKALRTSDPAVGISKGMKITLDEAKQILDLKVRQLSKLDQDELKGKLSTLKKDLRALQARRKKPSSSVKMSLAEYVPKIAYTNENFKSMTQGSLKR